jgi:hypothetical protein
MAHPILKLAFLFQSEISAMPVMLLGEQKRFPAPSSWVARPHLPA